jgi:hypothetical protein
VVIELVSPNPSQSANTGSIPALFSTATDNDTAAPQSPTPVAGLTVIGVLSSVSSMGIEPTSGGLGISLDPNLAVMQAVAGTTAALAYTGTVAGTYGTLAIDSHGNYTYASASASYNDVFTITTIDANNLSPRQR